MKAAGVGFKPDVVLLAYYAGNDLTDVKNNPLFRSRSGANKATGVAINRNHYFYRRSYLYQFVRQKAQPILLKYYYFDYEEAAASGVHPAIIEDAKNQKINPWLLKLSVKDKNYLLENILMETSEDMKVWEKVKEILIEIHDVCKKIESQLMIVVFPRSIQINRSHFEFYEQLAFNLDERTLESNKPQQLFMEFCEQRGIECLDILPAFKARAREEFYLNKDDHLNVKGNQMANELIMSFLLEKTVIGD